MRIMHEEIEVNPGYEPFGVIYLDNNGCCYDRPIVLTRSALGIISAQCACGGWCTNGHKTATAAVKEYEHMNKGRGIWDHAKFGNKIKALEECVRSVDNWEIERVRELYGDD